MFNIQITKNTSKLGNIVPKEGSRFAFNNVNIQSVGGKPHLVASDGKALVMIPTDPGATDRAMIPVDALKVGAKGGTVASSEVGIKTQDAKGFRILPVPEEHPDTFPIVERVLPTAEPLATTKINLRLLSDAIAALLANEGNPYDGSEGGGAVATLAIHPLEPKGCAIVLTYGLAKAVVMGIIDWK